MAVTLLVCAFVIASTATAPAATPTPSESLAVFEGQLNGHQVRAVTLRTKAHTFHVTLEDGRVVKVVFPSAEQQRLMQDLGAEGITVKVAKVSSPSHKRRYIIGGIVIVVIVLAVVGLLLRHRRRTREEE
jgi:ATP-dependent Zn protease